MNFQIVYLSAVSGTTPGIDKISYQMIKNLPHKFKERVLAFYNNIFNTGVIPQNFKTALIIPIKKPKKNDDNVESFRPISLLPCLSKLLEKIIAKRIMWFLNITNAISSNQTGFKPGSSTIDSLLFIDHLICKALSTKNHISILSIDFEKAFDKIGPHVILDKLREWKIGPKIFNYVKSFLLNRKIRCRVNNTFSETLPLNNGVPQGSPLSVVLFLIAFEELNKIVTGSRHVYHCLYADDLHIICNKKDKNEIIMEFTAIMNSIDKWAQYSGASIAVKKCKHLHICRQFNCPNLDLIYNNNIIDNVNNLSILGLIFDNKRTFKNHCNNLKHNLAARLNVIKYLSSNNSYVHTNTLLHITKLIIQSKIDYGLSIYGNCSQTHINCIKIPFNAAIRCSLRALRTTPIENLLAEGGLYTIEARIGYIRCGLLHKLTVNSNHILNKEIHLLISRKTSLKIKSGLVSILDVAKEFDILSEIPSSPKEYLPFWLLNDDIFINNLITFAKSTTSIHTYRLLFSEAIVSYKEDWEFIYTDGSKKENLASFAVVKQDGQLLANGIMTRYGDVFEAEAQAIFSACQIIKSSSKKTIICTDSRSVFEALKIEPKSESVKSIQQILLSIKYKTKIMWIPGHAGIGGNEHADRAAKAARNYPVHKFSLHNKNKITKIARSRIHENVLERWNQYNHYYKQFNPSRKSIILPTQSSATAIKYFIRLRLGHTILTHKHYFNKEPPPICKYCNNSQLTVLHLLTCSSLQTVFSSIFVNTSPIAALSIPSYSTIQNINDFVTKLNLNKFI